MTPLTPMNNAIAETKSAEAQAISEACQIDASITQALQTLASVGAPPPGMEDRILNRLRQHAQPGPATLQRRLASLIPQLSIAAAATACIVAAILVLHPNLHPSEASAIATAFTLSPTLSQPGSKPQLQPHSPAQPPTPTPAPARTLFCPNTRTPPHPPFSPRSRYPCLLPSATRAAHRTGAPPPLHSSKPHA